MPVAGGTERGQRIQGAPLSAPHFAHKRPNVAAKGTLQSILGQRCIVSGASFGQHASLENQRLGIGNQNCLRGLENILHGVLYVVTGVDHQIRRVSRKEPLALCLNQLMANEEELERMDRTGGQVIVAVLKSLK